MPTLTVEQAKQGGRRSAELRRQQAAELEMLRAKVEALEKANPPRPPVQPSEAYTEDRLTRVRKQLDRLDDMLMHEEDPQKLDRLVSASSRLEEQERKLSGRFAPGTTKPSAPARQRRSLPEPTVPLAPDVSSSAQAPDTQG